MACAGSIRILLRVDSIPIIVPAPHTGIGAVGTSSTVGTVDTTMVVVVVVVVVLWYSTRVAGSFNGSRTNVHKRLLAVLGEAHGGNEVLLAHLD